MKYLVIVLHIKMGIGKKSARLSEKYRTKLYSLMADNNVKLSYPVAKIFDIRWPASSFFILGWFNNCLEIIIQIVASDQLGPSLDSSSYPPETRWRWPFRPVATWAMRNR